MTRFDQDTMLRAAAFEHVRRLSERYASLTSTDLKPGFVAHGQRIPLINRQRGIFKPHQMKFLLSIKTVFPRPGGRVWYDDQRQVHRQIFEGDEAVEYAFMGQDPDAADNRWLRDAYANQVPVIYFLGISPGRYQGILPTYIIGWDGQSLKARIAFGAPDQPDLQAPATAIERRYALRIVAHIVADANEQQGQPIIPNGIPLSKIHHAAFDAHLIGIDPDYRLHVSERLLARNDGPMLQALKSLQGQTIHLPRRPQDRPDRDRLALRFDRFRTAL
jgi:putative restriction endonuclease